MRIAKRISLIAAAFFIINSLQAQEPVGQKGPKGEPRSAEDIMARLDKDKDGFISKDEAPERLKKRFARIDANKDEKLSLDELKKAQEIARKRKQRRVNTQ